MGAGEGDVAGGVPILGQQDVGEFPREFIDEGNNFVTTLDGQRAAGAEVVLKVDDKQGVGSGMEHHALVWHGEPLSDHRPLCRVSARGGAGRFGRLVG